MGGNVSRSREENRSDIFNKNDYNLDQTTINNISQQCDMTNKSSNLVQIMGSTVSNLDVSQQNTLKSICEMQNALKSTKDASVVDTMLTKLSQKAKSSADAGGFLGGIGNQSDATAINTSNVYNEMTANLSQQDINNITKTCIMQLDTSNIVQIVGSTVNNSVIKQANDSFLQCVNSNAQDTLQQAGVEHAVTADVKQEGAATSENTTDLFAGLTGSLASLSSLGVLLFPILICILVMLLFSSSSSSTALIPKNE